jgi:hypothetical protein
MNQETRDCRVYYVPCPEEPDHFILRDPADTAWEKTPPESRKTCCYLCGEKHEVNVIQRWEIGYVSSEERDQGWALTEPSLASSSVESTSGIR